MAEFPRSPTPVRLEPDVEHQESAERLATFLGWFSIGLGAATLAAPEQMARFIGADGDHNDRMIMRLVGLQELFVGAGILRSRKPAGWLWMRVAGDLLHLSMLSGAMASGPRRPDRMAATTAAIAGITALDAYDAVKLSSQGTPRSTAWEGGPVDVHQSVTIYKPISEVYSFWRDFRNLPRFMHHLESVEVSDGGRSHWRAKAPGGTTVQWDAEIVEDRTNELIAWRSTGGDVDNAGAVRFAAAPGEKGTETRSLHDLTGSAGKAQAASGSSSAPIPPNRIARPSASRWNGTQLDPVSPRAGAEVKRV